jgi:hypothetical protein
MFPLFVVYCLQVILKFSNPLSMYKRYEECKCHCAWNNGVLAIYFDKIRRSFLLYLYIAKLVLSVLRIVIKNWPFLGDHMFCIHSIVLYPKLYRTPTQRHQQHSVNLLSKILLGFIKTILIVGF